MSRRKRSRYRWKETDAEPIERECGDAVIADQPANSDALVVERSLLEPEMFGTIFERDFSRRPSRTLESSPRPVSDLRDRPPNERRLRAAVGWPQLLPNVVRIGSPSCFDSSRVARLRYTCAPPAAMSRRCELLIVPKRLIRADDQSFTRRGRGCRRGGGPVGKRPCGLA